MVSKNIPMNSKKPTIINTNGQNLQSHENMNENKNDNVNFNSTSFKRKRGKRNNHFT